MRFATVSTSHSSPRPALVSNGKVYPLPFPDMHAVIEAGAQVAAKRAAGEMFSIDEVKFHAPLTPGTLRDDYASSLGPLIVTREAIADKAEKRAGVYDLKMVARVNGVEMSRGNFRDIFWSFGEIIARASDTVELMPGDVIGSGTVGTGCLLELTKTQGPWLKEGDVVELEIEEIGILKNTIGKQKK